MTFAVSDLRDLRVTLDEWATFEAMCSADYDQSLAPRPDVDTLVLSGLLERERDPETGMWIDSWVATLEGWRALEAIGNIDDWSEFAWDRDDWDACEKTEPFAEILACPRTEPLFI